MYRIGVKESIDVMFKKGVLTLSVIVLASLVFAPMLKPASAAVFGVTSYAVVATAAKSDTYSITLNDIQPCNLIIVFVAKGSCGEAYTSASITDTAGLNFQIRTSNGGDYYGESTIGDIHIIEFYAKAVSYSGPDTITYKDDVAFATDRVMIALAISGSDDQGTNNPFDGAGYKASAASGTPTVTGVSPAASGELLLALAGYANSSTAETAETSPLSFSLAGTQLFSDAGDHPPDNETAVAESAIAPDTGPHTVTWGTPLSDDTGWCMFVDMIKPGPPCPQNLVPEVPLGTIMAATAMIAALGSYLLIPRFRRPKQLSS